MTKHADLRSFKDMTEEDKIAFIRRRSDQDGTTATRVLGQLHQVERTLSETAKDKRGVKRPVYHPKPKDSSRTKIDLPHGVIKRLRQMQAHWGVSRESLWRLIVYRALDEFGYLYDDLEVLRPGERKAIKRVHRLRRPYRHYRDGKEQFDAERERAKGTPFNVAVHDSAGSPSLLGAGCEIPGDEQVSGGDPDLGRCKREGVYRSPGEKPTPGGPSRGE